MEVELLRIKDKADQKNERVVMLVKTTCNIGDFILFDTTFSDDMISNKLRHTFWFPDKQVKAGDKVILYTKEGVSKTKILDSGKTLHFFYWGLSETVWNKDEDCAILVKLEDYEVLPT